VNREASQMRIRNQMMIYKQEWEKLFLLPLPMHRKKLSDVCSRTEANIRQKMTAPPLEWTVDA
jgi:hypothetical protein